MQGFGPQRERGMTAAVRHVVTNSLFADEANLNLMSGDELGRAGSRQVGFAGGVTSTRVSIRARSRSICGNSCRVWLSGWKLRS